MSIILPLPVGFGWVVLSGAASIITASTLGHFVTMARRTHGVPYPAMYDNTKPGFNAVQRGHQNMLETHYAQLWLMSIAGLSYPTYAATAGAVWTLGRIIYFLGYSTGNPQHRLYGSAVQWPAFFTNLVLASMVGLKLLGYM